MGWMEFLEWCKQMNRQTDGEQTSPDSWKGSDKDGWWVEQRRKRDEERRQR